MTVQFRDALETRPSLLGGLLCLDFVNSQDPSALAPEVDYLGDYASLINWGVYVGMLDEAEATSLRTAAVFNPAAAASVWQQAIALREALTRLFLALADEQPPPDTDLDTLNAALQAALPHRELVWRDTVMDWQWRHNPDDLERVIWPVIWSAAELLTSPDLARLHRCGARDCDWLFLDPTKNRSRRWCGDACSSREKARRYYRRHRSTTNG